jgi:sigma-B regulation protein RsbU (phosphoserine phosphatase)
MEVKTLDRIRKGLEHKRNLLAEWLASAPPAEQQVRLGNSDEEEVQEKLDTLDEAIEKSEDGTLGFCTVCHDTVDLRLLEVDYTACVCLDHYTDEEKRSLEYELELAQNVHRALLSHSDVNVPGMELAAISRPAQILGGDYFDILKFQNGCYALVIADIAGHGVSSSLYMASLQTALRMLIPGAISPLEVVQKIHDLYSHNIYFATFATLFIASYDPIHSTLTYINAGHNPPLLLCRSGSGVCSTDWLRPNAAAIGLVEEPQFEEATVPLHPGDLLILYTDGVTEAADEQEFFGKERLADFAIQSMDLPAEGLVQALWGRVVEYTRGSPLADDTTIVAFKKAPA